MPVSLVVTRAAINTKNPSKTPQPHGDFGALIRAQRG
jgi:hypothetical protein